MNTFFPIKAAFFDVDGTLLSHKTYSVPQSARVSIDALRQCGIKTYLCTGRHALELELLPISDIPFDGYITLNGHLCLDHNKQLLFGLPFPEEAARALISVFRKKRIPLVLVEENGLILNYVNDTVIRAQEAISTPVPDIAEYDGAPIYQATTFAGLEDDDLIREITPPDCQAVRWNDLGVDLILKNGGKVAGLRCVIERAGIRPEECIAFGDAENDIEMLEYCGIGVAMGNAQDKVKTIADYVTSDPDDDGIRNALRYYGII
ncbi:MAG: Cof-type HAD-IIB family hydrolase [Parasporobacterium sp.]|nr:Cof-type HAD-IIB family hydrolase [Parasporobacterium sp.]